MLNELESYFEAVAKKAKQTEQGLKQQVNTDMEIGEVNGKPLLKRTIISPDAETAKLVAENPKLAGVMHLVDDFKKSLRG